MTVARPMRALAALLAVLVVAAFLVSPGLFTIDEFIIYAGADAMLRSGTFTVQNGVPGLPSEQIELLLLNPGPSGLTPQYPPGTALAGAPLLALFGVRGLILLNTVAAAGTIYVLYRLASRHFGGPAVALVAAGLLTFGTFFLEYAYGVWPHATAVFFVVAAFALVLDSVADARWPASRMLLVGALVGLGILFRTDSVLAIPAIGLALFFFCERPTRQVALAGLGLLPFIAVASLINQAKFGTYNPISYGHAGPGTTNLANHLLAIAALAVLGLAALALRHVWFRLPNRKPALWLGAVLAAVAVAFAHDLALRYLHGFWALVVDATAVTDARPGVVYLPDGTVAFWGLWKKALGQSMPWLGLLLAGIYRSERIGARTKWSLLILFVVWSVPFFPKDWHGGMGSNMRYFLPLVPFACAFAAGLLVELWRSIEEPKHPLAIGTLVGMGATLGWVLFHPTHRGGSEQILPTWIFLATAALALASGLHWRGRALVRGGLLALVGAGLGISLLLAINDFRAAQGLRNQSLALSARFAALPDRAVVYAPSRYLIGWALEPGHVAALPDSASGAIDDRLIGQAFREGYRVFVWPAYVTDALRAQPGTRLVPSGIGEGPFELLELVRETRAAEDPGPLESPAAAPETLPPVVKQN
jgi:4-amino-4-deoxy-L-arabinose transferase-like glycosyltransferase